MERSVFEKDSTESRATPPQAEIHSPNGGLGSTTFLADVVVVVDVVTLISTSQVPATTAYLSGLGDTATSASGVSPTGSDGYNTGATVDSIEALGYLSASAL